MPNSVGTVPLLICRRPLLQNNPAVPVKVSTCLLRLYEFCYDNFERKRADRFLKGKGAGGQVMHTDEYGITLSRELNLCRKKVQKLEKILSGMECKYNLKTEIFVEEFQKGNMRDGKDFIAWIENYKSLIKWKEMEAQYEEVYRLMKI